MSGRPGVTKVDLKSALAKLGLSPGEEIAFHTSLSVFGHIEGGAETVIDAILETIGPGGTALAPTFTYSREHSPESPPQFDARESVSVTGATPEAFRRRGGAVRSLHPTHSWAAIGARAAEMIRGHEDAPSPCGPESPLGRLVDASGKVLLVGVSLERCTFIHYCEEAAGVPYHLQKRPTRVVMTDTDGRVVERDMYLHRWGERRWDLARAEGDLAAADIIKSGRAGPGEITLFEARPAADLIIDNLRRNAEYLLA